MKKNIIPLLLLLLAGCTKETPEQPVRNDYLVQAEEVNILHKEMLKNLLGTFGYGQYAALVQSDVHLIRVVYVTEYPKGTPINVSGALLISGNYNSRFPTVLFNHGTNGNRNSAPSVDIRTISSTEVFLSITMASIFNCAVLVPDYIGYGESKSITHPYMHGESLGQTGLDFIRAYREYMSAPAIALPFHNNIVITGYSEGGYASLALHKTIDAHPSEGLEVVKTIAGSGAYDLTAFSKEILNNPNPLERQMLSSYLWVIGMYKTDFRYSKNYADIFSEADNTLLQSIGYDLAYYKDVSAGLPLHEISSQLFKPEFISGVLDETDTEFISISKQNSFIDFTPKDSIIFVYGDADQWVYPVNSENAYNTMSAKQCPVKAYVQPGGDHETTLPLYLDVLLGRLQALNSK
jgi:predicted esterase